MKHLNAEKQRAELLQAEHSQLGMTSSRDLPELQLNQQRAMLQQERDRYYELQDFIMALQKEIALRDTANFGTAQEEVVLEDIEQLRMDVQTGRQRVANLQSDIAYLEGFAQAPPQSAPLSEHGLKLAAVLERLRGENKTLQVQLQSQQTPRGPVAALQADRYVEQPVPETRTVEVEDDSRVNAIIQQMAEMESAYESSFIQWRAKCKQLEWQPAKVKMKVIEKEDGPRCQALLEAVRGKDEEIARVKQDLVAAFQKTARDQTPRETVTIKRERLVEVPKKEFRMVEVMSVDRQEQLQRQLQLKDLELQAARNALRSSELQLSETLQDTSTMPRSATAVTPPTPPVAPGPPGSAPAIFPSSGALRQGR